MRVAICEDDREQRAVIRTICEQYCAQVNEPFTCMEYADGETLLRDRAQDADVLFLDIELGNGKDGIAVMKELEQCECVKKIVFISSHHEGVWDSFGWKTLGFVRKPFADSEVIHWLEIINRELHQAQRFEFYTEKGVRWIDSAGIEAILAEGNYVRVRMAEETFFASGTLKYWMEQMRETAMLQIHRSYAVNLEQVASIHAQVMMKSGNDYPIGRTYRKAVIDGYRDFVMHQARERL